MSRNNKSARLHAQAKQISEMRKKGDSGPSKTMPKHGKKWTYRHNPDAMKRLAEFVKTTSVDTKKSGGKAILEKAGGAAK